MDSRIRAGSRRRPAMEHCAKRSRAERFEAPDETHDVGRRLEGDRLHAPDGAARRMDEALAGDAQPERLQDLRARHGRPDGRDGQRSGALPGGLQEVAAGDGRRHAGRDRARVLRALLDRPAAHACRRASWRRAGGWSTPIYAGPGDSHYRIVAGTRRSARVGAKLKAAAPRRCFFYASGRSSNEAGFLLQLFARLFGTNNVNNCSYYCHQASGVGLTDSLGTGTATVSSTTWSGSDLFILIGGNPASNHPRLMRSLMSIRRRGGQVDRHQPAAKSGW